MRIFLVCFVGVKIWQEENCIQLLETWSQAYNVQGVSKRITRFHIIISTNENVLQLQNKLQTIK